MGEYKFQSLYVYQLALEYIDEIYGLIVFLPSIEKFNLSSQITRAASSIALNIAEGSTGQTDKEQLRFLGLALRSYLETIACLDLIQRRGYIGIDDLSEVQKIGRQLFVKINRFQRALRNRES